MKKNILQNLSLAFCICLFSVQISAQVIADPGNDPLSDSLPTMESTAAHCGKTTVFKNGINDEATNDNNFSFNKTLVFAGEQFNVQEINKKTINNSKRINKHDFYFDKSLLRQLQHQIVLQKSC